MTDPSHDTEPFRKNISPAERRPCYLFTFRSCREVKKCVFQLFSCTLDRHIWLIHRLLYIKPVVFVYYFDKTSCLFSITQHPYVFFVFSSCMCSSVKPVKAHQSIQTIASLIIAYFQAGTLKRKRLCTDYTNFFS